MKLSKFIDLKENAFKNAGTAEKEQKIVSEKLELEAKANKNSEMEKMKNSIKSDKCLWDMRCWDKYKDEKEVLEWIDKKDCKNSGYVRFCIKELLKYGVSKEEIKELIMSNPYIQYKKRLVKCWNNPLSCPRYVKAGNYADCGCEECE